MNEKKRLIDVGDLLENSFRMYKKYFRIFLIAVVVSFVVNMGMIFFQSHLQERFQKEFLGNLGLSEAEISTVKEVYQQGGDWENLNEEQKEKLVTAIGSNFEGENPRDVFKETLASLGTSIILPSLGVGLLAGLIVALVNIGIIFAIKRIEKGKIVSFESVFVSFKGNFWSLLWVLFLNVILVILWSLLLIIPGIIMSIYYSLSLYTLIFEDKKGMEALRESKALIQGYWWGVLGRYLFLGLLVAITMMVLSAVIALLLSLGFVGGSNFNFEINLVMQVLASFLAPFYVIYPYFIYKDLTRIKKPSYQEAGDQPTIEQPVEI